MATPPGPAAGGERPSLSTSLWRYRVPIVAAVIVAALLGYYVSTVLPPVYEATATVLLSDEEAVSNRSVDVERKVQQEGTRLTSRAVMERASQLVSSVGDLPSRVAIDADPAVGLLSVTARHGDAAMAAALANAVTQAYEQATKQRNNKQAKAATGVLQAQADELRADLTQLQSSANGQQRNGSTQQRIETLRAQILALESRITEIRASTALQGAGVENIEPATPPESPSSPQPLRNAVVMGAFGFAAAAGAAHWRAGVVDRQDPDPTASLPGPLLAEIPDFDRWWPGAGERSLVDADAAEVYQFLLTSFEYAQARSGARSVLITSASAGEGKSLTALHLARALAIQGRKILLIDSDLRARGLTRLLKAEDRLGLVDLAEGAVLGEVVRHYRISSDTRLPVIPTGRPPEQPTGLLATDRYREALTKAGAHNELTIIDGAPLLTVADASVVAAQVDGVVLVVDARTSHDALVKVRERMQLTSTPLLGYVRNRTPSVAQFEYPYRGGKDAARRGRWLPPAFNRLRRATLGPPSGRT